VSRGGEDDKLAQANLRYWKLQDVLDQGTASRNHKQIYPALVWDSSTSLTVAQQQEMDEIIEIWRDSAERGSNLARTNLGYAYDAGHGVEQDDTEALWWYQKAADNGDGNAYFNIGNVLQVRGDASGAMAAYRESARLDPTAAKPLNNIGQLLHAARDMSSALKEYKAALRLNPVHASTHSNLGALYSEMGRTERAEASLRSAIRYDENMSDARYNLAKLLRDRGDASGAESEFRAVLNINANDADSHFELGVLLSAKGDTESAVVHLSAACELAPQDIINHFNLAFNLMNMGKFHDSIISYGECLEIDPGYFNAHYNLGFAYDYIGDKAAAEASFLKAIKLDPPHQEARLGYINLLIEREDFEKTETQYRALIELAPESADHRYNLGATLHHAGDIKGARGEFLKALKINPSHSLAGRALRGATSVGPGVGGGWYFKQEDSDSPGAVL